MRKDLALIVVSLLILSVVASGCVTSGPGPGHHGSGVRSGGSHESPTGSSVSHGRSAITVTDMLGRTVKVPANVSRVVAVGPGALRILVYLNATDKVVGIEEFEKRFPYGRPYILAHPELLKLPVIGPGGPGKLPNMEALIKVHPQVIFMVFVSRQTADEVQQKTG
ncbi:MAG: iron ABC transporter substrate-binding protein, partial [Thermococci archaeon]|nr:iron ABC transporter substrate-binding protein [Thermococci archaeon]